MFPEHELEKSRTMMRRKEYAGIFFGASFVAFVAADVLHGAGDPSIASATVGYSAEEIAHHRSLLDFRNYFAIGAVVSLLVASSWISQSRTSPDNRDRRRPPFGWRAVAPPR